MGFSRVSMGFSRVSLGFHLVLVGLKHLFRSTTSFCTLRRRKVCMFKDTSFLVVLSFECSSLQHSLFHVQRLDSKAIRSLGKFWRSPVIGIFVTGS